MAAEQASGAAVGLSGSAEVSTELSGNTDLSGDKAYEQLLPEFAALERFGQINVDVPSVVALVIGSVPEILENAEAIRKVAPEITVAAIEKLRTYALALNYAHALWLSAAPPQNNLDQLVTEATERFARLSADANALVTRGLINGRELEEMQSPVGHKNVAVALTRFTTVLRANWDRIQGKCALTLEELDATLRLAELILTTVGLKEQGATRLESATEYRLRAFAALAEHYDNVRQAVSYVRWKRGDADEIAPSLYSGRSRKRSAPSPEDPGPEPVPAALEPASPAAAAVPSPGAEAARGEEGPNRDPWLTKGDEQRK